MPSKKATRTKPYPYPGTNAERILTLITVNPGISVSGIATELEMNPSPTRGCIKALIKYGLIEDQPDAHGHHYHAKKGA